MLSNLFLGLSLAGAEWVLYFLLVLSVISIALIVERALFYRQACKGLVEFRSRVRTAGASGDWKKALELTQVRLRSSSALDFESQVSSALLEHQNSNLKSSRVDVLSEVAQDALMRTRIAWEQNLSWLATIGSNAVFVGLFGTVLGIIHAFHELSQKAAAGAPQTVMAGISEALIATAFGILVAIPAVVAFNLFQRRVKAASAQAEALKSFLVGRMSG